MKTLATLERVREAQELGERSKEILADIQFAFDEGDFNEVYRLNLEQDELIDRFKEIRTEQLQEEAERRQKIITKEIQRQERANRPWYYRLFAKNL